MDEHEQAPLPGEDRLRQLAQTFAYPPTPDVARRVAPLLSPSRALHGGRWGWARFARAAALSVVIALALLAVPAVRAGVLRLLQLGGVRILLSTPAAPLTQAPVTATPAATPVPLDLGGATTLAEAQRLSGLTIHLPAYPPDLGQPDQVFLQDFGGPLVILVWLEPGQPERVRLSLHILTCEICLTKVEPVVVETTEVNGRPALWTTGPYLVHLSDGDMDLRRLIEGHVLIWTDDPLTYRLETSLPLPEAIRIAESLNR